MYQPLRSLGLISGAWRTTYPFSDTVQGSDAHMLSSYFSFHGALLLCIWKNELIKIKNYFFLILFSLTIIAMLLTGSRNGVLSLVVSFILVQSSNIKKTFTVIKKKNLSIIILFFYFTCRNNCIFTDYSKWFIYSKTWYIGNIKKIYGFWFCFWW